jgi:hypothetical protein
VSRGEGGDPSGPAFEATVFEALQQALLDYCDQARLDWRVDPKALRLRVMVVTGQPLAHEQRLRMLAEHVVRGELSRAELEPLTFALQSDISPPGYWFRFDPPLPGDTTDPGGLRYPPVRPAPDRDGRADQHEPTAVWDLADEADDPDAGAFLVLVYHPDLGFYRYPLYPADRWLGIGRDVTSSEHRPALRLPRYLSAVPRGGLLEVRYWQGNAELRRSAQRPEYAVWVNERRLAPGLRVRIGATGLISYRAGSGAQSVLRFQLRERSGDG